MQKEKLLIFPNSPRKSEKWSSKRDRPQMFFKLVIFDGTIVEFPQVTSIFAREGGGRKFWFTLYVTTTSDGVIKYVPKRHFRTL